MLLAIKDDGAATRVLQQVPAVGVVVLTKAQGAQLRAALAGGHDSVTVKGSFPSPYTYDLVHTASGAVGDDTTAQIRDRDLGVRRASYHQAAAGFGYETRTGIRGDFFGLNWTGYSRAAGGTARDELLTPGYTYNLDTNRFGNFSIFWAATVSVARGETVPVGVAGPMVGSGGAVVTTNERELWIDPSMSAFGSPRCAGYPNFYGGGASIGFEVSRDGAQVCSGLSRCVLTGPGRHQVVLDASQSALPLSIRSRSAWSIDIPRPDAVNTPQAVPAIGWNWDPGVGPGDTAPAEPYQLTVRPAYATANDLSGDPVRYDRTHGEFRVTVSVTYDDGASWQPAGTRTVEPGRTGTFTIRPPATSNGYVGYRITGSDQAGNSLDQWALRVARVPAG